jgi:response regulator RpfG family c-di-GMP phosphodiesterase
MPKMDGYELYDKIKKIDDKVRVCFLTAYGSDEFKARFLPTLSDGISFMRKPITTDELVKKTNEMIEQKRHHFIDQKLTSAAHTWYRYSQDIYLPLHNT